MDALQIEMACIKQGGVWKNKAGKECGLGRSRHLENMRRIIWPELDGDHNGQRWHTIIRDTIVASKVTVLMGPGSSGKTHACWIPLCEYFCSPDDTCVLLSSTDIRGLRLRIWGEITSLWEKAVQRFGYLPGHLIDSKLAITTDQLEEVGSDDRSVRDFRKGIVGIPTVQNGKFVGLGKWIGIKQVNVWLMADEAQAMGTAFLSAFANLNKNVNFRAVVLGNPNDPLDPLGKAAEPKDGWDGHMEPEKTTVWETRFMNGRCVNLIGTDSPNFDFPEHEPTRFPYLISKQKIADTLSFFPKDSVEYYSQCIGSMKIGQLSRRVLTRRLCEQCHAREEEIVWLDSLRTRIFAVDAAYGGDRAVGGWIEFGKNTRSEVMMLVHEPAIIPILVRSELEPEYQIAEYVKRECGGLGIPPENMFHDATGRGSLGTALSRVWSPMTNPVESGGRPSERPVCLDLFIYDPKLKARRLKLCVEHYSKRVTEFWFSVRYVIEGHQMRGLPEGVMEEFCMREWRRTKEGKIEIETKEEMKERVGRSPDLADWLAIAVEGARRRGFQIKRLANTDEPAGNNMDWLRDLHRKALAVEASKQLTYN